MKKIETSVFTGIDEQDFDDMIQASLLRERNYLKNEYIFRMGDVTTELGIVMKGSVIIENTDAWGNTSVLTRVRAGGVFAETYALSGIPMMVDAKAHEDAEILFLNLAVLDNAADTAWHRTLTNNLLRISAHKNITLSERMFCLSSKTVRGKVLAYLSGQANLADQKTFTIPFNRQQLADYLNVDRTALSKELGKMKKEGLIEYHLNIFTICKTQEM